MITNRYNIKKYDRTLWYRINYGKLNELEKNYTDKNTISAKCPNEESQGIEKENLILAFEENICNLRKTTSIKFHDYIEKYNKDFIMFVIEYCDESGIKSFAGFKTVIDSYIKKKIFTREDMLKDIEKFRAKKKNNINKKPIKKSNYNKTDSFIDFEQRNYTKEEFKQFEEGLSGNHDLDLNEDILKRYPNLEIE